MRGVRTMLALALAAAGAGLFSLAPRATEALPDQKYTIRFATIAPEGSPWAVQLKDIKERVEKESEGRIKIKLYLGQQLGGELETIKDLRRGRIQGGGWSVGAIATIVPDLQLMELPYLFETYEECDYVMDNVLYEPMAKACADKGFILAVWGENGFRSYGTKARAIRKPEDLAGLKMRSQENAVHLATYKALRANAVEISTPEVLGALQTGLVDGFDNTPIFSAAANWQSAIKYFTLTEHCYQPAAILYNKQFFDSMPTDLQKILIGDPKAENARGRKLVRDELKTLLTLFKESGIEVIVPSAEEKAAFRNATRGVHDQFRSEVGPELLDKVYAAVAEVRAKAGKGSGKEKEAGER